MNSDEIVENAPDAILRFGPDGAILEYMGAAEQLFDYSADEILGQPLSKLMPGVDVDEFARDRQSGDGAPINGSRKIDAMRKDGSVFPVEMNVRRVASDGAAQYIGIVRDIAARHAFQARNRDLQAQLEAANRRSALVELADQMTQELAQPLTAAATFLDALEIKLNQLTIEAKAELIDLSRLAAEQTRRAGSSLRHIHHVLAPVDPNLRNGNFHDAVAEVMDALLSMLGVEDVEVAVNHIGDGSNIAFDEVQLHQVLANLVANALAALEKSSVKRLTITSEVRDDEVELRVSDSGSGVPDELKDSIFNRFMSESLHGLGLGLSIATRIAESHSGKLWVEDGPDGGAVFRMVFPLKPN